MLKPIFILSQHYKRYGVRSAVSYALSLLMSRITGRVSLICFMSTDKDTPVTAAVREVDIAELTALTSKPEYDLSLKFLQGLNGKSDKCFAYFEGSDLAAYAFFSSDATTAIDNKQQVKLGENMIYLYKVFTAPDYRRRGAARACVLTGMNKLGKKKVRFIALVDSANHVSIRFFKEICYSRCGQITLGWEASAYKQSRVTAGLKKLGIEVTQSCSAL